MRHLLGVPRAVFDALADGDRAHRKLSQVLGILGERSERIEAALPPEGPRRVAAMHYLADRLAAGHPLDAALAHLAAGTPPLLADQPLRRRLDPLRLPR